MLHASNTCAPHAMCRVYVCRLCCTALLPCCCIPLVFAAYLFGLAVSGPTDANICADTPSITLAYNVSSGRTGVVSGSASVVAAGGRAAGNCTITPASNGEGVVSEAQGWLRRSHSTRELTTLSSQNSERKALPQRVPFGGHSTPGGPPIMAFGRLLCKHVCPRGCCMSAA